MSNIQIISFVFVTVYYSLFIEVSAQKTKNDISEKKPKESKSNYIKAKFRSQLWTRYIDMNPGTTVNGENVSENIDFSIRRIRIGIDSQVTKRLYFAMELAGNNLNQRTSKGFSLDIFNLSLEYTFSKALALGYGKNSWQGFSRFNVYSSSSFLTLDSPSFLIGTVNKNDHNGRGLGFWIKGQLAKFDYTLVVKKPDLFGEDAKEGVVNYAKTNPRMRVSAYLKYQFFDMESNKSGYSTGTYLGKKKVLNIGIGYMSQDKMMWKKNKELTQYFDYKNYSVEVFCDMPTNVKKTTSITAFFGYYSTDFGDDYTRNVGVNGYASGGTSFNGVGHAFPMIGTGTSFFTEVGYMFSLSSSKSTSFVQPYYAIQSSRYKGLNQTVNVHDVGFKIYFNGHKNKLALGYQSRPIFDKNTKEVVDRKDMIILEYQLIIDFYKKYF